MGKEVIRFNRISNWRVPRCPGHQNAMMTMDPATAADHCRQIRQEAPGSCLYHPEMHFHLVDTLWLEHHLGKALRSKALELYYQPKVGRNGQVSSVEALLRWHSPERGLISPLQFINFAETSGQIIDIGRWVMDDALRQAACWRDKGIHLRIAVNISPRQLSDNALSVHHKTQLPALGFARSPLDIELTETCRVENSAQCLAMLCAFSNMGSGIQLDDFGTGYATLERLIRFPFDAVKLDKSVVREIHLRPPAQSLVKAIITLARSLNMEIIAEGVETREEDRFLTECGVTIRQGFLFARPMTAAGLEQWLQHHQPCGESGSILHDVT